MNITKQTTPNECGICVLTSLYRYFNGKKRIDKISILNNANISEQGLSLYDFENLASKLGINTEIYELEWSEFINYKSNNFLVMPIQIESGMHYVIVKKFKKFITIYDSRYKEPFSLTYEEFHDHFAKLIITVEPFKQSFNFQITSKIDLFKNIKINYLLISIAIQMSIIALSTISANYLNMIINTSISNSSFKNGLIVTFVFFVISLLNGFTKYIFKLFTIRGFKQCFMYLSNNLINSLNLKKADFINKVDKNHFYLIDSAIQTISNFLTYEISTFCSNICLSIITFVIIVCINPYFLIASLVSIFVIIVICFVQYHFKNKILTTAISNQSINNNICKDYIEYFCSQKNNLIQNKLNIDLKRNYHQFIKLYIKKTRFDSTNYFISELFYNLIYFLIILISSFLIINNKNMNVGQLTFLVAIFSMFHNAIEGICDFVVKKVEFNTMNNIYDSIVRTSNEDINNKFIINKINSISLKINDDYTEIENGQYVKNDLINTITNISNNDKTLLVNNMSIDNINSLEWRKKIFLVNLFTHIKSEWLLEKISDDKNELVIEGLKLFQINLVTTTKYSLRDQIILNLLYLPYLANQLIILDNTLKCLTSQELVWVNNVLLPYIKERNFVLFTQMK